MCDLLLCSHWRPLNFLQIAHLYVNRCKSNKIFDQESSVGKGKAVSLQAWGGQEGSRKLRFPDS